jgi:hypothetical protein
MKQSGKKWSWLLVACALGLGGCTSIPLGSLQDDLRAKSAVVRPGKAQIYVYRYESLGFAVPITVKLDGRASGRTVGQTYVMWEVEPGLHEISSHAEDASAVSLNAEPGKAYFIWQEVKVGLWKARSSLHHVDEETGRKYVAGCRLGQV